MRLLDRYIARQVFVSAIYAIVVIIVVLILGNVFKEILRELNKRPDLSLGFVFKFILLFIPISLSLAIPFSFLTSILLTFGRLSADSEFVSMRMAGLSMWRICLPVGVLALFFTGICAWVNLSITPAAKLEMEGMKDSFLNQVKLDPLMPFTDRQVMTEIPGRLIFARKEGGKLKGVQVVQMQDDAPYMMAIAKEAEVSVDLDPKKPEMILKMNDVNLMLKGQEGEFMDESQPVFMKEATVGIPFDEFAKDGEDVRDQPENISLKRLVSMVGDSSLEKEMRATYQTELSMRLAFSVSCLTFGLIGVPLGITAQRRESTAGFVLSMIIAVAYYVLLTLAQMQRENEEVYPHLLVWIPNILFLSLGILLFWRLSRR